MKLLNRLIDLIYPPRCLICRAFMCEEPSRGDGQGIFFCETCLNDFRDITPPLCPVCGRPFVSLDDENHLCEDCLRKRPFYETTVAPYIYEGALMTAIHHFKYGARAFMAQSLGTLLARFAKKRLGQMGELLTIPVPLHPKRLRHRGFNQSLLLARHVADQLDAGLDFLSLRRVRYTLPQTGLRKDDRRKNVRGAFQVKDPGAVKKRAVLLVDDVATTGNTLNECARALRKSGCDRVICLVLARAKQ